MPPQQQQQQQQQQHAAKSGAKAGSGGPFSASDLNRIVLEYLNKKGYHQTEAMLRNESSRPSSSANPVAVSAKQQTTSTTSVKRNTDGVQITSEKIRTIAAPENYIKIYGVLKNWVDTSLELYREELQHILYPIFIYIFLQLVKQNPVYARNFFDKFSKDFKILHNSEINRLFSVNSEDHIKENEIANAFATNRYKITISRTTFNLLLFFLNENESNGASLIISIINQHLDPVIKDTAVNNKDLLSDGLQQLLSDEMWPQKNSLKNLNSSSVKLGLFPKDEEFIKEVETELKIRDEQHAKNNQPPPVRTLLEEYQLMNANDNATDDEMLEPPARDSVPLPPNTAYDIKLEIQKVKESRDAIPLDNLKQTLPSVCMYTFHNTNRDMTSLEFSDDSRTAAAGFQDSFIRIWSLDGTSMEKKFHIRSRFDSGPNSNMATLIGHSDTVYSTSFSPDKRYLVSGSADKTVRLWSLETQTALVKYKGHNDPVWDVQFSSLGHYFASASHDQTARLWSCDHIFPLRIFTGHSNDVDCLRFHPNGRYIFTGSSDKTCRMWDISNGECVRIFLGHTASISCVNVTPNGRWLTTADTSGVINVWDIASGKKLKQMVGHGKSVIHSLSYSKEGNVLVSGGADHTVRIWDMLKTDTAPEFTPDGQVVLDQFVSYIDKTPNWFLSQDLKDHGQSNSVIPTTDLVASFYTKDTPVRRVQFTRSNLVLAGGPFSE